MYNYVNLKTKTNGYTALHYAVYYPSIDTIKLLIEFGADIKAITNDGLNILHIACLAGNIVDVIYIIDKLGFDVNTTDNLGNSPLHWAVYSENKQCIEYLIKKGAKVNCEDKSGLTPMHMSLMNYHTKLVIPKMLLHKGGIENKVDGHSRSCIDYAKVMNNTQFIKEVEEKNSEASRFVINFLFSAFCFIIPSIFTFALFQFMNSWIPLFVYYSFLLLMIICSVFMFFSKPDYVLIVNETFKILDIINDAALVKNFCLLCNIEKQDNYTEHCLICDKCVDGYGRHSYFYHRCIGRNNIILSIINYIIVILFYLTNVVYALLVIILYKEDLTYDKNTIPFMLSHMSWLYQNVTKNFISVVILVYSIIVTVFLFIYLISEIKLASKIMKVQSRRKEMNEEIRAQANASKKIGKDGLLVIS